MPYLGGVKVEYRIESSGSLHPGLDSGGHGRKLGVNGRTFPGTPLKKDQKQETRDDSSMAERGYIGNYQETGDAQNRGKQTKHAKHFGIGIWITTTTLAEFRTVAKSGTADSDGRTWRFRKTGNQNPAGRAPTTDHGGKVYHDSDFALKTIGRSLAGNMHLLIEFTRYWDWGGRIKKMGEDVIQPPIKYRGRLFHQ